MVTKERIRLYISACMLLWLGLMIAPAVVANDGLPQVDHAEIDFLFAAGDVVDTYHDVYLEPISVWYPSDKQHGEYSANALRQAASGHVEDALSIRGLELVTAPSDESLIVRIQYIDLTATPVSPQAVAWAKQFRFRVEPGHITIVAETRDAATGRVLMRMADVQDENEATSGMAHAIDVALRHWSDVIAANIAWPPQTLQVARVAID